MELLPQLSTLPRPRASRQLSSSTGWSTACSKTRAQASEADRQLAEALPTGPLHGVPVTIKINSDQAGHATTNGARAFKDLIAEADAPHVLNWRNAGAVFIGRTNTPAYSIRWFTDNDLHGRTLNPWDESRTPGGSSGGAAVAVATGMGALAHGNDVAVPSDIRRRVAE
jgi:amidase